MATPLNTTSELIAFSSFREGDEINVGSPPMFKKSQFESALQRARDEIYDRTIGKENDEFGTRLGIVKEAELYLAVSRLYDMWGDRLGLLSADANIVNVGSVGLGADTPPPLGLNSKMEFFVKSMSEIYRAKGLYLLRGKPYEVDLGAEIDTSQFPCLLSEAYSRSEYISYDC